MDHKSFAFITFEYYRGFQTCELVCDGATPNMTMIKEMSGAKRKAYG